MGQLLIRNLDDATKQKLRERAARHGHSMEAEVRAIIGAALRADAAPKPKKKLGTAMREIFAPLGGVDLPDLRNRLPQDRKPISFDDE